MEKCQRCGEDGQDRRTLYMACLYDMSELGIGLKEVSDGGDNLFTMRVCKDCRADWMDAIKQWFTSAKRVDTDGANIPVRIDGTTRMLTREEFETYRENTKE